MLDRSARQRVAALLVVFALVLSGLAVLLVVVPVRAQTVDASGATSFAVTAISTTGGFSPNTIQNLASGTNITVMFTDADSIAHTFTIWGVQGTVIPNPQSVDPGTLEKMVYGNPSAPLVNVNLTGSDQQSMVFSVNATPGWYEFMCMEPGHFQSGMYGFIAFGEPLPSNLSVSSPNTGPGAAVFIIVGTIVSLTVIAIVLGFVVGRRRGSEFEMPPERLGYPEPTTPGGPAPSGEERPPSEGPPNP